MSTTRTRWLPADQSVGWFQLTRHDDPEPTDPEPAPDPEGDLDPESEPDPEGADELGDKGKQALRRMKEERDAARAELRKKSPDSLATLKARQREVAEAKKRAEAAEARVREFEDRDKSDLDKATTKAERLEAAAAKATARAVKAEVKAAAAEFADPEDAAAFLDLATYTSDDGEIDTEAISADLEALLERKPHLRRVTAAPKPPAPKPDPGQGPRPSEPPTDFRTADRADLDAELAKVAPGFRIRS